MKKFRVLHGYEKLTEKEYKSFTKLDTIAGDNSMPEEIAVFDTLDEAKSELRKYKSVYDLGGYSIEIEEYAIEEYEADEDGEFVSGSDYYPAEESMIRPIGEEEELTIEYIMDTYSMNIKQISDRFSIPYRTVQNWCSKGSNRRECPEYIVGMMIEILEK